jgi:hypothetical protein
MDRLKGIFITVKIEIYDTIMFFFPSITTGNWQILEKQVKLLL